MKECISITNLNYRIGNKIILNNINLTINEGEVFSLYGVSGSGKSTLLKIISGLISPTDGKISVFGIEPKHFDNTNRSVASVWQSRALFPHLTVKDNIWFGLKYKKSSPTYKQNKYEEIVELLKIDHLQSRTIDKLSGGEAQKVALARALVIEPRVLLLDEPFTGLDKVFKDQLKEDLRDLIRHVQCTYIFVSHDTDDVYSLSNRIAIIENHTISQVANPSTLFDWPNTKFIAESIGNYITIPAKVTSVDHSSGIVSVNCELGDVKGRFNSSQFVVNNDDDVLYCIPLDSFSLGATNGFSVKGVILNAVRRGSITALTINLGNQLKKIYRISLFISNFKFENILTQLASQNNVLDVYWDFTKALIIK